MGTEVDEFAPWHIILLVIVLVVLFGAKKLPMAARSLGESMRIFKAETKGLHDDDQSADAAKVTPAAALPVMPQPLPSSRSRTCNANCRTCSASQRAARAWPPTAARSLRRSPTSRRSEPQTRLCQRRIARRSLPELAGCDGCGAARPATPKGRCRL